MAKLLETKKTLIFEVPCPHCRSTVQHPKMARVVIEFGIYDEKSRDATITDIRLECDGAQKGQDRT